MYLIRFGCALCAFVIVHAAQANPCPCVTDVDNCGGTNIRDFAIVLDCARDASCDNCTNSCDVNCDGNVDYYDVAVIWCAMRPEPDCCNQPDGACTDANSAPPCVMTSQHFCEHESMNGTFHGDLSQCSGDQAIDIPAVSTWGLGVLAIGTLTVGTILIQRRRASGT
ncbi:MAG: hypothetical protein HY287_08035 [Planctomycetes bacterium]|nr:hypothetical protein [Planctomycetota bacterium]